MHYTKLQPSTIVKMGTSVEHLESPSVICNGNSTDKGRVLFILDE